MNFYITLTRNCNLQCSYCYGKSCQDFGSDFGGLEIDYSVPTSISYELSDLTRFIEKDPHATIIFYGGEPLLEHRKITELMDRTTADRYILQTNGLLLDRLGSEYTKRLDTVLISIDGSEQTTDRNRGEGVYRTIVRNLKALQGSGFEGEIIARMTVPAGTEIDREVDWLISNRDYPFKSIHWQLDAMFWQSDFDSDQFRSWSVEVYDRGVDRLVQSWVERMEKSGEVLKIYPFISVMESLLLNQRSKLRCGAGWNTFNIQTDGKITPCPVMAGIRNYYLGDIWTTDPKDLADSIFVGRPCTECDILHICGGRCLYANVTRLWGDEGYRLVCDTVSNLVNSLRRVEPEVRRLLRRGRISPSDFKHGRYNSCEVIP
ncbi:MAG: TIGR04084 family radical SAM/SPASM domain-containing protein [Candidatus Bathyarchaeia archaeon]